jgi:hypothetical protein
LIRQGAIAGVALDAGAEQKAQASLMRFLSAFATSANIDAVNIEWFPRSISSGDVDHFAALLHELKASLPAKQLLLTTGFSSAFNSTDQQMQFYTLAVSNLGDFRASEGVNSNFLGVVFRQAFQGLSAGAMPPASGGDLSRWDWTAKAKQLNEIWGQGGKSEELTWWLNKVQDNMGLLSLQPNGSGGISVVPLPAQQSLQQISTTVAQVSQNVAVPAYAPYGASFSPQTAAPAISQSAMPSYSTGVQAPSQSTASPFQQMMFTILQQFTTQMTTTLAARLTRSGESPMQYSGGYPGANVGNTSQSQNNPFGQYGAVNNAGSPGVSPSTYPSYAPPSYPSQVPVGPSSAGNTVWIGPQDVTVDATNVIPGQSVRVTTQIHNGSTDRDISGLTVLLADPSGSSTSQPMQNGVAVPRSGLTSVQVTWIANQSSPGPHQMVLQILDANGIQLTSAAVPAITVTSTTGSSNPGFAPNAPPSGAYVPQGFQAISTQPGASPPSIQSSAPAIQPQITYFGPTDTSSAAAVGQIPPLSLQVANSSDAPMQPVQAQLFVDGTTGQFRTLGPLLPKQTRSAVFAGIPAASGTHAVQVVVTTADGAMASATISMNATPPTVATTGGAAPTNSYTTQAAIAPSSGGMSVRAGTPTSFSIGSVSQSMIVPSSNTGLPARPDPTGATTAPAPASAGTPVRTITPGAATAANSPNTNLPARPGPTGATAAPAPASAGTPVRTITPGAATAANSPNTNLPMRPGPTGATAAPAPPAATGTAAAAPQSSGGIPARPGPAGTATTQTPPAPASSVTRAVSSTNTEGSPDPSVSVPDVHFNPAPYGPGQSTVPTTFTAMIRNSGTSGTQGANVVFTLMAGEHQVASQQVPFSIAGHGTFQASWTYGAPIGPQLRLVVSINANGIANPANSQAAILFKLPPK